MRAVVQRVTSARVLIDGESVGAIGSGLAVLLGIAADDTPDQAKWLAEKIVGLRIFADADGKMNRDLDRHRRLDADRQPVHALRRLPKGETAQLHRRRRPADRDSALRRFHNGVKALGVPAATGRFGADMQVELVNDGPVTLIVESNKIPV